MTVTQILQALSNVPIIITALYALIVYKHLNQEIKIFALFIFFSFVIQITSFLLAKFHTNNMIFLHLNVYGSVGFLGWFYAKVLSGFIGKNLIKYVVALFWIGCIVDIALNNPLQKFNSMLLTVECVLMIIIALFTFSFMLNPSIRMLKKEMFISLMWINSGIFIYFTSNILLFFFNNTIVAIAGDSKMWIFHAFFITVMYSCFFIGIWKRQRN